MKVFLPCKPLCIFLFFLDTQGELNRIIGGTQEFVEDAFEFACFDGHRERVCFNERFAVFFSPSRSSNDSPNASHKSRILRMFGTFAPSSQLEIVVFDIWILFASSFCVSLCSFRNVRNFSPNSYCVIISPHSFTTDSTDSHRFFFVRSCLRLSLYFK